MAAHRIIGTYEVFEEVPRLSGDSRGRFFRIRDQSGEAEGRAAEPDADRVLQLIPKADLALGRLQFDPEQGRRDAREVLLDPHNMPLASGRAARRTASYMREELAVAYDWVETRRTDYPVVWLSDLLAAEVPEPLPARDFLDLAVALWTTAGYLHTTAAAEPPDGVGAPMLHYNLRPSCILYAPAGPRRFTLFSAGIPWRTSRLADVDVPFYLDASGQPTHLDDFADYTVEDEQETIRRTLREVYGRLGIHEPERELRELIEGIRSDLAEEDAAFEPSQNQRDAALRAVNEILRATQKATESRYRHGPQDLARAFDAIRQARGELELVLRRGDSKADELVGEMLRLVFELGGEEDPEGPDPRYTKLEPATWVLSDEPGSLELEIEGENLPAAASLVLELIAPEVDPALAAEQDADLADQDHDDPLDGDRASALDLGLEDIIDAIDVEAEAIDGADIDPGAVDGELVVELERPKGTEDSTARLTRVLARDVPPGRYRLVERRPFGRSKDRDTGLELRVLEQAFLVPRPQAVVPARLEDNTQECVLTLSGHGLQGLGRVGLRQAGEVVLDGEGAPRVLEVPLDAEVRELAHEKDRRDLARTERVLPAGLTPGTYELDFPSLTERRTLPITVERRPWTIEGVHPPTVVSGEGTRLIVGGSYLLRSIRFYAEPASPAFDGVDEVVRLELPVLEAGGEGDGAVGPDPVSDVTINRRSLTLTFPAGAYPGRYRISCEGEGGVLEGEHHIEVVPRVASVEPAVLHKRPARPVALTLSGEGLWSGSEFHLVPSGDGATPVPLRAHSRGEPGTRVEVGLTQDDLRSAAKGKARVLVNCHEHGSVMIQSVSMPWLLPRVAALLVALVGLWGVLRGMALSTRVDAAEKVVFVADGRPLDGALTMRGRYLPQGVWSLGSESSELVGLDATPGDPHDASALWLGGGGRYRDVRTRLAASDVASLAAVDGPIRLYLDADKVDGFALALQEVALERPLLRSQPTLFTPRGGDGERFLWAKDAPAAPRTLTFDVAGDGLAYLAELDASQARASAGGAALGGSRLVPAADGEAWTWSVDLAPELCAEPLELSLELDLGAGIDPLSWRFEFANQLTPAEATAGLALEASGGPAARVALHPGDDFCIALSQGRGPVEDWSWLALEEGGDGRLPLETRAFLAQDGAERVQLVLPASAAAGTFAVHAGSMADLTPGADVAATGTGWVLDVRPLPRIASAARGGVRVDFLRSDQTGATTEVVLENGEFLAGLGALENGPRVELSGTRLSVGRPEVPSSPEGETRLDFALTGVSSVTGRSYPVGQLEVVLADRAQEFLSAAGAAIPLVHEGAIEEFLAEVARLERDGFASVRSILTAEEARSFDQLALWTFLSEYVVLGDEAGAYRRRLQPDDARIGLAQAGQESEAFVLANYVRALSLAGYDRRGASPGGTRGGEHLGHVFEAVPDSRSHWLPREPALEGLPERLAGFLRSYRYFVEVALVGVNPDGEDFQERRRQGREDFDRASRAAWMRGFKAIAEMLHALRVSREGDEGPAVQSELASVEGLPPTGSVLAARLIAARILGASSSTPRLEELEERHPRLALQVQRIVGSGTLGDVAERLDPARPIQ